MPSSRFGAVSLASVFSSHFQFTSLHVKSEPTTRQHYFLRSSLIQSYTSTLSSAPLQAKFHARTFRHGPLPRSQYQARKSTQPIMSWRKHPTSSSSPGPWIDEVPAEGLSDHGVPDVGATREDGRAERDLWVIAHFIVECRMCILCAWWWSRYSFCTGF